ncbi:MAG TPA: MFS transporter [Burkholderiales bacterium]|nr:MFS transporter [Burkholderiales bacterium]
MEAQPYSHRARLRAIPGSIWALGFVSLLMDVSSEMIHALLPVYLVTVLGTSLTTVGLIEGIAEATASITRVFSGALSDWMRNRKLLAVLGYGLAALSKPIFPLASAVSWVVAARFIDRMGKGIRGAPRDALVADLAPVALRGASFGLRQALDTVGAFLGPLLAMLFMWLTADAFRIVFWIAVLPAFLSLALIVFAVREPARPTALHKVRFPLHRDELARLGKRYWLLIAVTTVFTLARFSEAFLVLRAQAAGVSVMFVPGVLVLMNAVYALAAYPAGAMADRAGRRIVFVIGVALLVLADLVLAGASSVSAAALGVALWGLHMGFTQGVLATLVTDMTPAELRGTAFGVFNLITGLALLAASVIAGFLWDRIGAQAMFLTGALLAAIALAGLLLTRNDLDQSNVE